MTQEFSKILITCIFSGQNQLLKQKCSSNLKAIIIFNVDISPPPLSYVMLIPHCINFFLPLPRGTVAQETVLQECQHSGSMAFPGVKQLQVQYVFQ